MDPLIVQAVYPFKGTNNDELCFAKGDKITVTQREEGGWWEGTLGDKTGWFPSNYVKECRELSVAAMSPLAQQRQYRAVVLKDLHDSEMAFVAELQTLITSFLVLLEKANLLSNDEYKQLTGNIKDVLKTHQELLSNIEEHMNKLNHEQRVGKLFLLSAPKIKEVHQTYCSLHPKAVCIIDKYKDELTRFMESKGAVAPGLLVLTTGLSKPFRRLEKYTGMLQELERHIEESHPDRGDTQRSVAVYKELSTSCCAIRRQKELELQVLTGPVRGWEGQSLSQLGDIIHMGSVAVGPQHHDRYLVLFPDTLLMLSVSHRMSAFIYEGKLPVTGIAVNRLEDTDKYKNAFEIAGPLIEKIVAVCQSKEEAKHWVDLLRRHTSSKHHRSPPPPGASEPPLPPPHMTPVGRASQTSIKRQTQPPAGSSSQSGKAVGGWSYRNFRPMPAMRHCVALKPPIPRISKRQTTAEEDLQILEVIESYCPINKPRNTASAVQTPLSRPKDNTPTRPGSRPATEVEQKLIESLILLKQQMKEMTMNVGALTVELAQEKTARCALQNIVKNYMTTNNNDLDISWPPT